MRLKRSPVQSLSASPELQYPSNPATIYIVHQGKRHKTSNNDIPALDLAAVAAAASSTSSSSQQDKNPDSPYSDASDVDIALEETDSTSSGLKVATPSSDSKLAGLKAAKKFVSKAVELVGPHSARIPTHRELLHLGLTNAVQVRARKFLVSINGIAVNVRTRLCDSFKNLGELLEHLETYPDTP